MVIKNKENQIIKLCFLIILIYYFISVNKYFENLDKKNKKMIKKNEDLLKIFIMTHKDFNNSRYNHIYNIVADDKASLKNKYNLNIIYADEGKLHNMKRAYGEMSKLYYIYQLYKNKNISSKYIGLNHYRRYFNFTDNIPDLEKIFENFDVILNEEIRLWKGVREFYCLNHICKNFDELIEIIRDIKPEYYNTSLKSANETTMFDCNLFIMKKEDFFKYCEFMFDILFEFDKRKNFTSDDDILEYLKTFYNDTLQIYYQSRIEAFLSERISNIFFKQYFKKIKKFPIYKQLNLI